MDENRVHVVRVNHRDGAQDYLTLLPPETVFSLGLIPEVILGVLRHPLEPGEAITPANFVRNRPFVDFLHRVLARHGPDQPTCQSEARRVGTGFIYLVDQRTPTPDGDVPPEDILGAWEVQGGQIQKESYRPNPNHQILTTRGFFQLDTTLHQRLLKELNGRIQGS